MTQKLPIDTFLRDGKIDPICLSSGFRLSPVPVSPSLSLITKDGFFRLECSEA